MMGKYWSVFLLAGLGIAALADPRRGAILPLGGAVGDDRGRRDPVRAARRLARGDRISRRSPMRWWRINRRSRVSVASGLGFLLGVAGYIAAPVVISALDDAAEHARRSPIRCGRASRRAASC